MNKGPLIGGLILLAGACNHGARHQHHGMIHTVVEDGFLPPRDAASLPLVAPTSILDVEDGGRVELTLTPVRSTINGVDVVGDDFLVQDLTVLDAPKDGIRVENSNGVTYRRIKATWTNEGDSTNGAYGIYPVRSQNVLVEESIAERSSDAGLQPAASTTSSGARRWARMSCRGRPSRST